MHGTKWSKVAEVVGTRNGDQCWKRWNDSLNPQIDHSSWDLHEVSLCVSVHGLWSTQVQLTETLGIVRTSCYYKLLRKWGKSGAIL